MYGYIMLKKQKIEIDSFSLREKLVNLKEEVEETSSRLQKSKQLLRKIENELFYLDLYQSMIISNKEYEEYLERKNCSNYHVLWKFIDDNDSPQYPMLTVLEKLGLSERTICKLLGIKQASLARIGTGINDSGSSSDNTNQLNESSIYNDFRYYRENKELAISFAKELMKKKVYRTKIVMLLGLNYHEVY